MSTLGISGRRAASLVGMSRNTLRAVPPPNKDQPIRERMSELAQEKRRYGARRLHVLLKREGLVVNHKKTERIYRELGLSIRTKKRKRLVNSLRLALPVPVRANEIWATDFIHEATAGGRRIRCLTILDVFSRECLAIEVATSIPGASVVNVFDRLREMREAPKIIVTDNGPEFTGRAMGEWVLNHNIKLAFIRPGKPIENAFIESFNGRFRDECLNEHWFRTIEDARAKIEAWRLEYNSERPHSALGHLTPLEYASQTEAELAATSNY
jgi:putative transposase